MLMRASATGALRADIVAGLTTAAVVIPKAMAFAAIAGLPLEIGLYTALIPLLVYAAVGTSRPLSVTTTSTLAILVAGALATSVPEASGPQRITAASSLALMVGGTLLIAALLRLGFLADFISAPVLTGFKAGIAIVIVVDQIPKLLGIHFAKGGFLQNVAGIAQHAPEASAVTLGLAGALLALIVVLEKHAPTLPAPLIAVATAIAVSGVMGLERYGLALVGEIRAGLPAPAWPDVGLAARLWPLAIGIALMSFVETIAAGRAFVRPGEPLPVANRELLALGLANAAGSVFHNMPAGGGTSQTAVNRAAGARTQAAGVVAAAAVLATLLFLASVVALMPEAALAAVVVATSVGLFKPSEFAAIRDVRQTEFWWAVAAAIGVVLMGTLNGILFAVVLSVLTLFYQANHPPVYVLESPPGLLVLRTEGSVYFANAHRIGEQMWRLVHEVKPRVVALDLSAVPNLEYTGLKALAEGEQKLREAGVALWLVAPNPRVRDVIGRAPLGAALGDRLLPSLDAAVDRFTMRREAAHDRP